MGKVAGQETPLAACTQQVQHCAKYLVQVHYRGLGTPAHALQQGHGLFKLLPADVAGVFLSHVDNFRPVAEQSFTVGGCVWGVVSSAGVVSALQTGQLIFNAKSSSMKPISFVLAAVLAATAALPAVAQVSVNINVPGLVQVAPPPPRMERMPSPRSGQVWVPGHWQWGQRNYAWRPGYWQTARPDYTYNPGHWVQANGGWRWSEGDWRRSERREERRDDHHHKKGHGRGDRDDHGNGHCPPGQAKKGRC